jgi:hypothetical protein
MESWDTFAVVVGGASAALLAVLTGAGLYLLERRTANPGSRQRIAPVLEVVSPNIVTSVLLLATGVILVFGVRAGLYVLIAPVLAALGGGLGSAWLFMTRLRG